MTRPSATSGSPYNCPSRVDEVQAFREGRSFVCTAGTPVASAFPWYVVQLEPKPEVCGTDLDLAVPAAAMLKEQSSTAVMAAVTTTGVLRTRTTRSTVAHDAQDDCTGSVALGSEEGSELIFAQLFRGLDDDYERFEACARAGDNAPKFAGLALQ
jgi:hypothetical protein